MAEEKRAMLDDEILEGVNGGVKASLADAESQDNGGAYERHYCIKCGKTTDHEVFSGNRIRCKICKTVPTL